jgi:hypothetical protein
MDDTVRAEAAKQMLGNPVFDMVLDAMRKDVIAKWSALPANATQDREWAWMFYQNTLKFEEILRGFIATGRMADDERKRKTVNDKVRNVIARMKKWPET